MKVKKYVMMPEEALIRLAEGLSVQGGLQRDHHTGALVFTPHDLARYKEGYKRPAEELIAETDFGRVTETPKLIKVYEKFPKRMGTPRMVDALDRDVRDIKIAIKTNDMIDRV